MRSGDPWAVEAPSAACLAIPRSDFLLRGGLDEAMWLFFSDADWHARERAAGRPTRVAWDVRAPHVGGASMSRQPSWWIRSVFAVDHAAYARARYTPTGRRLALAGLVLLEGVWPAVRAATRRDLVTAQRHVRLARAILSKGRPDLSG